MAAGTTAQLIINASRFVPFRSEDMQAAYLFNRLSHRGIRGIAPQNDVGASAGHISGDRHLGFGARLSDNLGFHLVIFGV